MDFKDELQFENLSGDESIEDDDRLDEIKQLLTEGFNNENFDDESELSFSTNDSNHGSVILSTNSNGGQRNGLLVDNNIFSHAKMTDAACSIIENEPGLRSFLNGIGLNEQDVVLKNGCNGKKVRFLPASPSKGSDGGSSTSSNHRRQSDRGTDEIEVMNPTISLLHHNHCPQSGDDISTGADSTEERLKIICQLRERQIQRAEENIKELNKDKRSLNHHIGLMKTEMYQMNNNQNDLQKVIQLQNEEIKNLKIKLTESSNDCEEARKQELVAKRENESNLDQIAKLKQQVALLSSIGSSNQQAEIDEVVRQINDKHSKEISKWKTAIENVEKQLLLHKRSQHSIHDEPIFMEKQSTGIQTDEMLGLSKSKTVATEDFGQTVNLAQQPLEQKTTRHHEFLMQNGESGADISLDPHINVLGGIEKWKMALAKSEEQKNRLIEFYEKEVQDYKTKLSILPSQLYTLWRKQQEELGLLYAGINGPTSNFTNETPVHTPTMVISHDIGLVTDPMDVHSQATQTETEVSSVFAEQVNPSTSTAHAKNKSAVQEKPNSIPNATIIATSSSIQTFVEKEFSSVVIQTDETLETYHILGNLIEQWAKEVAASSKRAEDAEREVELTKEEFKKFRNKFRKFYKSTVDSRKQWQEQEKLLRQKYEDSRQHCIAILSMVSEKLDIVSV